MAVDSGPLWPNLARPLQAIAVVAMAEVKLKQFLGTKMSALFALG